MKKTRVFAALLCLALAFALLPRASLAADLILCGAGPDANGRYKTGDVYAIQNTMVHLVADIYDAASPYNNCEWVPIGLSNNLPATNAKEHGEAMPQGVYPYECYVNGTRTNTLTLHFVSVDANSDFWTLQMPQNQTVAIGETATFTANVGINPASTLQVGYEWCKANNAKADWVPIPGTNAPSYTPPALTAANADTLYCVRVLYSDNNGNLGGILWESDSVRLVPAAPAANVPETGDDTPLMLLVGLVLLAGAGLAVGVVRRKRNSHGSL